MKQRADPQWSDGREFRGLGEKHEWIKRKEKKKKTDTDNTMVISRGERGWGEALEGKEEVNGDGRRLDFRW